MINTKREELKKLFQNYGKNNKAAIKAYESERDRLLGIPRDDTSEYDSLDMSEFAEYRKTRVPVDIPLPPAILENLKLEFYLRPPPMV